MTESKQEPILFLREIDLERITFIQTVDKNLKDGFLERSYARIRLAKSFESTSSLKNEL